MICNMNNKHIIRTIMSLYGIYCVFVIQIELQRNSYNSETCSDTADWLSAFELYEDSTLRIVQMTYYNYKWFISPITYLSIWQTYRLTVSCFSNIWYFNPYFIIDCNISYLSCFVNFVAVWIIASVRNALIMSLLMLMIARIRTECLSTRGYITDI